jgi:hypothetical protein
MFSIPESTCKFHLFFSEKFNIDTKSKVIFYYNNRIIHTIMNVTIFKIIKSTVHQAVYFIDLKIYNNARNNVCHYKILFPNYM